QAHRKPKLTEAQQEELQAWVVRSCKVADQVAAIAAEQSRRQIAPLVDIQRSLPADAALIFWTDLHGRGKAKGEHWGCVLRAESAPVWVPLPGSGAKSSWIKADGTLTARLRADLSHPSGTGWRELAQQLYRQRLEPLEPHLKGVRHLIVVPSSSM